ncbi:MAG: TRAP transporter substrate-binding protein [Lysobacterales bacterium]
MTEPRHVSPLVLLVAVITALGVGVLASLAIRPPGAQLQTQATSSEQAIDQLTWRATSSFTAVMPIIGTAPVRLADDLRAMTGGAIDITVFDPGAIVPALEITESVKEKKIDAGYQWVGYDQGRIPASTLIAAVPFGMEPQEFLAWWYFGGGQELGESLYAPHQVMPILCSLTGPETAGWFRRPVSTAEDLVGLKIRFAGLGGKVLQRLGASVTMIPGSEIFQALEKGAIDATEFAQPVIDELLGFSRVAKYNYFPGWHQPFSTGHLQINLEVWNTLRDTTQATIRVACRASVARSLAEAEALQGPVVKNFEAEGVVTSSLPLPLLETLRATATQVLDEEAAKDPYFAEILASQRGFSATYRRWKILGYLPRDF